METLRRLEVLTRAVLLFLGSVIHGVLLPFKDIVSIELQLLVIYLTHYQHIVRAVVVTISMDLVWLSR